MGKTKTNGRKPGSGGARKNSGRSKIRAGSKNRSLAIPDDLWNGLPAEKIPAGSKTDYIIQALKEKMRADGFIE